MFFSAGLPASLFCDMHGVMSHQISLWKDSNAVIEPFGSFQNTPLIDMWSFCESPEQRLLHHGWRKEVTNNRKAPIHLCLRETLMNQLSVTVTLFLSLFMCWPGRSHTWHLLWWFRIYCIRKSAGNNNFLWFGLGYGLSSQKPCNSRRHVYCCRKGKSQPSLNQLCCLGSLYSDVVLHKPFLLFFENDFCLLISYLQ